LAVSTAVSVSAKTIVECSDNFDDFSGTYLAPVGWHFTGQKANLTNGATQFGAVECNDSRGDAVELSLFGKNYITEFIKLFDDAYTSGYLKVSCDVLLPEQTDRIRMDFGLLESYDTVDSSIKSGTYEGSYDFFREKGRENGWSKRISANAYIKPLSWVIQNGELYHSYSYVGANTNTNLLTYSSSPVFSERAVEENKWYTIEAYVNLNDLTVTTYLDGEKLYENVMVGSGKDGFGIEGIIFALNSTSSAVDATTSGNVYVDNVCAVHSTEEFGETGAYSDLEEKVSLTTKKANVMFDGYVESLSDSDITLVNTRTGDEYEVTVTGFDNRSAELEFSADGELDYYSDYEIRFQSGISPIKFRTAAAMSVKYMENESFDSFISNSESGYALPLGFETLDTDIDGRVVSGRNDSNSTSGLTLTAGSKDIQIFKMLSEPITDETETFTIEFDMKSHNGGMYINLISSGTKEDYPDYIKCQKIFGISPTTQASAAVKHSSNQVDMGLGANVVSSIGGSAALNFNRFDEWVHVKMSFSFGGSSYSYCKYYIDGEEVYDQWLYFKQKRQKITLTDLAGIGIGVMGKSGSAEPELSIDNLVLYKGSVENPDASFMPVVEGLSFESLDGNLSSDLENVSISTNKVIVNFNTTLSAEAVNKVMLLTVDGDEADCTKYLSDNEKSVIIELNEALGGAYQVTAESGIKSQDGVVMERNFFTEFAVNKEALLQYGEPVIKHNGKNFNLSDLTDGDSLTVSSSIIKTNNSECNLMIVYCAYSKADNGVKKMLDMKYIPIRIASAETGIFNNSFTVMATDVGNIDEVSLFLCDYKTLDLIYKKIFEK